MSDLSPADLAEGRRLLEAVEAETVNVITAKFLAYNDWLNQHDRALFDLAERAEKAEAECKRLREENAVLQRDLDAAIDQAAGKPLPPEVASFIRSLARTVDEAKQYERRNCIPAAPEEPTQ